MIMQGTHLNFLSRQNSYDERWSGHYHSSPQSPSVAVLTPPPPPPPPNSYPRLVEIIIHRIK
ncbi:hypothetical protein NECAME_10364, partial [Necator americanus]